MQTFKRERHFFVNHRRASLVAPMVKNPPAMQETWVRSLGWEDPPKEGMVGYPLQYSCLENLHGQRSLEATVPGGHKESDMTKRLGTAQRVKLYSFHSQLSCGACTSLF